MEYGAHDSDNGLYGLRSELSFFFFFSLLAVKPHQPKASTTWCVRPWLMEPHGSLSLRRHVFEKRCKLKVPARSTAFEVVIAAAFHLVLPIAAIHSSISFSSRAAKMLHLLRVTNSLPT
jgi:hypothetical protein